ncbi:MAG: DUF5034 domain-containing protein [Flavobacteriales bacterium]|jgi:hypothetical protein
MKTTKILFILMFPLISELLVSCCDCGEPVIEHYTNQSLAIENLDNSGSDPIIATSPSVPKEAFGIKVIISQEKLACFYSPKYHFIPTASAFGCGCDIPYQLIAKDTLQSIEIFTMNDFDSNHPSNSDVSHFFKVFRGNSFDTLSEFLNSYKLILFDESQLELSMNLLLMTPPSLNVSHSFKVKITLTDGRVFEETTLPIELI